MYNFITMIFFISGKKKEQQQQHWPKRIFYEFLKTCYSYYI